MFKLQCYVKDIADFQDSRIPGAPVYSYVILLKEECCPVTFKEYDKPESFRLQCKYSENFSKR